MSEEYAAEGWGTGANLNEARHLISQLAHFEIYDDEDAYKAHGASEHFKRYGLGQAIPVLESRERKFYETIDV